MDYDILVKRYWINRLFCWHSKEHLRIQKSNNGVVAYCNKCGLKHTGIWDFGLRQYEDLGR